MTKAEKALVQTTSKETLETSVWRSYAETYRKVYTYINSDLRQYGLTPPQYTVMLYIGTSESGTPTMSEIGKRMVVTYANVTTVVDNLERRSLVRRIRDSNDRRRIMVQLTPSGLQTFQKIRNLHVKGIENLMKALDEEELANLMRYTEKLKNRASP